MRLRYWHGVSGCLAVAVAFAGCAGSDGDETPTIVETSSPSPSVSEDGQEFPNEEIPVIDLASASPLMVVYAVGQGDLRSDQPGLAMGDVNDDDIQDIVIGARFADGPNGRLDSGAAYLILGSANPQTSIDLAASEQDATFLGARPGDNLGFSAAAADLNGDGVDDMILGAPFAGPLDRSTTRPGRVYIVFGSNEFPSSVDLAEEEVDVTFTGINDSSFFGDSIATGDVNGDGLEDLIIGATFDRTTGSRGSFVRGGAVYVFFGREHWPRSVSAAKPDIAVYGADEFDELGDFVTSGDINGDGFDDIIATAEAAEGPNNARPTAAEVHVVFGREDLSGTFEISRNEQDLSVFGANDQDTLGFSLATGDLDADGVDDLVMGAHLGNGPDNTLTRAGQIYVLFGRKDLPSSIDLADLPDSIPVIYGQEHSSLLGNSEAVADLDGDGRNELIMGTGFADGSGRPDAGAVYIAEAPKSGTFVSVVGDILRAVVYGASADDYLGTNVATGDFNGDGLPELVAVADGADGPDSARPAVGRVYVITPPR